MSPNLTLVIVSAVLIAAGVYLMLERSLTRILVGVLLAGNGVNVLFLVASGRAGGAPIIGTTPEGATSDPLPQALVLTAIVITLGVATFLLTLAYRSFQVAGHDEVRDDVEDARIQALADSDLASQSYDDVDSSLPSEDDEEIGEEEVDDQPDNMGPEPVEGQDDPGASTGSARTPGGVRWTT